VQRHRGVDPGVPGRGLGGPAGGLEIVGNGDGRENPDGLGSVEDCADVVGVPRATRVEVGVGVYQRGQRLWWRRCRTLRIHRNTIR
jgi:hypothetical protein